MLSSMTGFGSAGGSAEGVEYVVEIRSVNSRYYKSIIKLPDALASTEPDIEKALRSKIVRGSIAVTVRMTLPDEQAAYRVNVAALGKYVEQIKLMEIEANPTLRIDLGAMLQLPGVCEPPPLEDICRRTHGAMMGLVDQALGRLVEMRRQEGQAMKADLLANCLVVKENLDEVAKQAPQVIVDYQQRLTARVKELTAAGNINIDQEDLAREVAVFAERCDIAEEVTRLRGHLQHFAQAIEAPEPTGRKLDFIAQEMLREANTTGSKANDGGIARAVVEIKTAIDRIKEQVQNVE
jgi:uncharacterized protein (TIGR00255 family)